MGGYQSRGKKSPETWLINGWCAQKFTKFNKSKKLQKRAARIGFDWKDANKVINKIEEELDELKIEHSKNNKNKLAEEVGDILFTIVNLTRHYDLDPEDIMRRSNLKFEQRFKAMEKYAEHNDLELDGMSVDQLEEVWQKIKWSDT